VVDEALGAGEDFLDGLRRIGVDEVAYRKGHRYLLCVVDHDTGRIVWAHPGRSKATLALFFCALGPERAKLLGAVSVDLHGAWPPVIRTFAPQAAICADPLSVQGVRCKRGSRRHVVVDSAIRWHPRRRGEGRQDLGGAGGRRARGRPALSRSTAFGGPAT